MSRYDHEADERHVREEVRRFKQHLLTYCLVVGMLFLINLFSGGIWDGDFWFLWVAFFWGIAIAFQAARLFGDDVGKDWEDRTVARIMSRRHGRPYTPPPPPAAPSKPAPGEAPPRRPMRPEPVSDYTPPAPPSPSAEPPPASGPKAEETPAAAPETPAPEAAPEPSSEEPPKEAPPSAGS